MDDLLFIAAVDYGNLGIAGVAASIITAISFFIVKGLKAFSSVSSETIASLKNDLKFEREEKHRWRNSYTKLQYAIDDERLQFRRFLESKGIDPGEFIIRQIDDPTAVDRREP